MEGSGNAKIRSYRASSRTGPCFVCAYLAGHPDYEQEPVCADDHVVAFLSRYPTLRSYTIVAPRSHIVDVTGDRTLFRRVSDMVHDVGEALKITLPTERVYLMSLGSHQGNAHVHWHVVPLPPGVWPVQRRELVGRAGRWPWGRRHLVAAAAVPVRWCLARRPRRSPPPPWCRPRAARNRW